MSRLFGGRILQDKERVYDSNAWDQIEWDEEQLELARSIVHEQSQARDVLKGSKYETEAMFHWNQFYKQHRTQFFKDRKWLAQEFPQILNCSRILEMGCGVGNTLSPLLALNPRSDLKVFGCDFSETAIKYILNSRWYEADRCHVFVHDIVEETFSDTIEENSLDCILLIFVLSSIQPNHFDKILRKCFKYLKPGGWLLFRDYGLYDLAQLRFKKERVLDDNFYVRGDGTRVYFFTREEIAEKARHIGFELHQNQYDKRLLVNRLRQLQMYRVWIQAQLRKPDEI